MSDMGMMAQQSHQGLQQSATQPMNVGGGSQQQQPPQQQQLQAAVPTHYNSMSAIPDPVNVQQSQAQQQQALPLGMATESVLDNGTSGANKSVNNLRSNQFKLQRNKSKLMQCNSTGYLTIFIYSPEEVICRCFQSKRGRDEADRERDGSKFAFSTTEWFLYTERHSNGA